MAYSVSAMLMEGVDPGSFAVYMGDEPREGRAGAGGHARRSSSGCVTSACRRIELDRAKEHLIGTHAIGLQRNGARAGVMALDTCYGLGPEALSHYEARSPPSPPTTSATSPAASSTSRTGSPGGGGPMRWLALLAVLGSGCTCLTQFDPESQPCEVNAAPADQCLAGFRCEPDAGFCKRIPDGGP